MKNPLCRFGAVSGAQTDRQTDRHGQQSHFAIFGFEGAITGLWSKTHDGDYSNGACVSADWLKADWGCRVI